MKRGIPHITKVEPLPPYKLFVRFDDGWASVHKDELMRNWEMARAGMPPEKIEPLK